MNCYRLSYTRADGFAGTAASILTAARQQDGSSEQYVGQHILLAVHEIGTCTPAKRAWDPHHRNRIPVNI